MTFGWLAGEVVRRVSGKTIGQFIRDEIALPLDLNFFVGLPQARDGDVAEMIAPKRAIDMSALPLPDAARMALVNPRPMPKRPTHAPGAPPRFPPPVGRPMRWRWRASMPRSPAAARLGAPSSCRGPPFLT